jgi:hypothetical protein
MRMVTRRAVFRVRVRFGSAGSEEGKGKGEKKMVRGEAAKMWRGGRRGYMKRTSLWAIRERMRGTMRAVVASWAFMVRVRVVRLGGSSSEGRGGGKRDW